MSYIIEIGNVLAGPLFLSIIIDDIFRIFAELFPFDPKIYIIVCYILFVVLAIFSLFIIKYTRRKINKELSYSTLLNKIMKPYEPSIEEKYDYYRELKIDKNMNKALTYLIIGFTTGSEMFVDFSLISFCFDNYKEKQEMLITLIQLLSYFKSKKKLFDEVLKKYYSLSDNSYFGSFIFLQANRVKISREVTSNISSIRLNDLKQKSRDLEIQIKSFWSLPEANTNTLESLESQKRYLNNLWDESIEENWSSISFREINIHFIIESCTDFHRAVQLEILKEKIDILSEEREDLCFLSLLMCFPNYLHNKIVDKNGNFIKMKKKSSENSSSSGLFNNNQNSSSANDSDFTFDDQVANSLFTNGRLRLSMQNALRYVRPKYNNYLIIFTGFSILVSLVMIITYFSVYFGSYDTFDDWNQEVGVLIELRIAYVKSFLSLSILFGKETNRFLLDPIDCNKTDEQNKYFFDDSIKFNSLALMYVNLARNYYNDLMGAILQLALRRVDISTLSNLIFDLSINSSICYFDEIIDHENWSMEQTLNFEILSFSALAEDDSTNIQNWFTNNTYWCHDITTFANVQNLFNEIQNALAFDLSNTSFDTTKYTKLQMIIIFPLNIIIFVFPLPLIMFLYSKDINYLIRLMLSTDQEYKDQAMKSISFKMNTNEPNEIVSPISKLSLNWRFIICSLFTIIFFCCFIFFEESILCTYISMNDRLTNFGFWSYYFSLLRSYLIEILIEVMNDVYYYNYNSSYITNADFKRRIHKLLNDLAVVVYNVFNDTPECTSMMGVDELIDHIVLKKNCEIPEIFDNIHDIYKCASLNRHLSTIHSLVENVIENIGKYEGVFKGEELTNLYHIIFIHSISKINEVDNRFTSLRKEEISKYKINLFIYFISGIVFLLFYLLMMISIIIIFKRIFNMALCLIRRLSPIGLINNNSLINYLLSRKNEEIEIGLTHTIFNNSFDGIICLNVDGIVEIINKTFANDYGYSPEQLVGQLIGTIFENESRVKLENQLKLMKNHESRDYGEQLICFTNDGKAVTSFVTLFSIKENENNLILVIRDETILLQKKKRLELAKKKSQDLLEQIMPPKVLMMLKEGKSEISFAVPSATVMFVDIANFSQFSTDLSPQQIMGTLSTLFGAFDIWIQKYPLMTKIKLIGDTYMAACGLFVADEKPKEHAKQSVDFSLRVLNILDDTNIKLNTCLQIRIGINSDGPIIAGVLGTENRVFDIIGDTINVASRLEHKSEPGHILMSEKTYVLVKEFGYNIVPKGEIFLKGKGEMPAYEI